MEAQDTAYGNVRDFPHIFLYSMLQVLKIYLKAHYHPCLIYCFMDELKIILYSFSLFYIKHLQNSRFLRSTLFGSIIYVNVLVRWFSTSHHT